MVLEGCSTLTPIYLEPLGQLEGIYVELTCAQEFKWHPPTDVFELFRVLNANLGRAWSVHGLVVQQKYEQDVR